MDALVAGHNSGSSSNYVLDWFELDFEHDDTFHDHELDADLDDDAEFDAVYAVDVDADGDVDVVAASAASTTTPGAVYWYKHNWFAGNGTHFRRRNITAAPAARSVYAVDLDDDGDVDLLSASCSDNKVAWYEQDASVFTKHDIETVAACASDTAPAVYAADVDGDGRIDVVSASSTGNKVAWHRSVCKNKLEDTTIKIAVTAWFTDQPGAVATYGHISTWDTSEVTNMDELFCAVTADCSYDNPLAASFNEDISAWDTSGATTMERMFHSASSFNRPIGDWRVDKVTSMRSMFYAAASFNQDIGGWRVDSLTDMSHMFNTVNPATIAFNQDLGWCIKNTVLLTETFDGATACSSTSCGVKQGVCVMDDSTIGNAVLAWFDDPTAAESTYGHISMWDTSGVTNMKDLFCADSTCPCDATTRVRGRGVLQRGHQRVGHLRRHEDGPDVPLLGVQSGYRRLERREGHGYGRHVLQHIEFQPEH